MDAYVISVNVSTGKGTAKSEVPEARLIENYGIEGDAHAGTWHRQVSLLSQDSINKMTEEGIEDLIPGSFAENITTEGIILYQLPIGTRLKIGETIQEVTQIGKTCHTGCAISQKVGHCIMPKEGIFTKVIQGGIVKPGDKIIIINKQSQ